MSGIARYMVFCDCSVSRHVLKVHPYHAMNQCFLLLWLDNIPFCLSSNQWTLLKKAALNIHAQVFCGHEFSVLWVWIFLEVELLAYVNIHHLTF